MSCFAVDGLTIRSHPFLSPSVQNMVSNLAYWRWNDAYPIVRAKIDDVHRRFQLQVEQMDKLALAVYHDESPSAAVEVVTSFSVSMGEILHEEWLEFYGELFVRFRDFVTIVPNPENTRCGCDVQEAGFTDASKERIVRETGTHYQIPSKVEVGLEELAIY